jgi:hypothetical protein
VSKRLLLLLVLLFSGVINTVFAQDAGILPGETHHQPKERSTQVTASVRDTTPPSTPILIAPENSSIISTNKPTFIWKESTDAFGINHYTLSLDGSDLFTSIPTTNTETDQYTLTYDAETTYFSLTPKNNLADGQHTWKITAHDFYTNTASSVTWSFTIDTQSPTFVITKIDETETSISAQDVSTVPATPIELKNNEPVLSGTGEVASIVNLTVRLPGGATQTYKFTISDGGVWEVQLGQLPRDVVIYLDFLITDKVGHISVLNDVPIILVTPKIIITIPFIPPEVIPPEILPPIEIPIIPIIEVIPPIVAVVVTTLPEPVQQLISAFPFYYPTPQQPGYNYFLNLFVIGLISFLPILKTILLAFDFGGSFSPIALHKIWQAIGLIPFASPQGIVVEQNKQTAVPYARVIFSGKYEDNSVKEIVTLTNTQGVYPHAALPKGKYRVSIDHPYYQFPTLGKTPNHLNWETYYQGQEFTIKGSEHEPALVIPLDKKEIHPPTIKHLKYWILRRTMATFKLSTVCLLVTVLFPSIFNIIATIFYWLILSYIRLRSKPLTVHGTAVNIEKAPIFNLILFLMLEDHTRVEAITQSKSNGTFMFVGSKDSKLVRTTDFTYTNLDASATQNTVTIAAEDIHNNQVHLPLVLHPLSPNHTTT